MKSECELICGHASRQHPHVMHRDSGYAVSWLSCDWRGPGPSSCEPSSWIHAFTFFRSLNIRCRSTTRSRTSGNLDIGSSVIVSPFGAIWSIIAEHDWRTLPLMTIVHEPHTSSRQTDSHTIGATVWPRRLRLFLDLHQRADDVHRRLPGDLELLPAL